MKLHVTLARLRAAGSTARPALFVAAAAVLLSLGAAATSAEASGGEDPPPAPTPRPGLPPVGLCLACHGQPGIEIQAAGETTLLPPIPAKEFAASAHGDLACAECHPGQVKLPHELVPVPGQQGALLPIDSTAICSSCHQEAAERFDHTVHGIVKNLADPRAPGCIDCHSPHAVVPAAQWTEEARAQMCARCHEGADATFASASLGHKEPSRDWFPTSYFAERFLIILMAGALAFGTLHVELDILRWGIGKARQNRRGGTAR
jgi:predicted CXXCH cytochrome family protein